MTDLTLGLVLVGGLAVAGVLLYNRLQERSARRQAQRAFPAEAPDVLADPQGRREPRIEPVHRQAEPPRGAAPDPRVDYIMQISFPAAAATELAEGWTPLAQRFARRALLFHPSPGRSLAALQMVSRAGVVPESELVEFRSDVETLAARLGGAASGPAMLEALEAARELDRACAEADIQVALHVVGVAPQQHFDNPPFQSAPREDGVTLTLDVTRTPEPARTYEAMARAGRDLARAQGGRLVDDRGRELDERALASIGAQLETVRRLLAGRGIEPGSPLALRLFS